MNVPDNSDRTLEALGRLMALIGTLRSEDGCPWDRKQTPRSFHPYILEEYHELVQAINDGAAGEIIDELGDLLFLVVFLAYMFEQEGLATLKEIVEGVVAKMIRRHPHVFGDARVKGAEEVIENWGKIKASEENIKGRDSLLDGIPRLCPR